MPTPHSFHASVAQNAISKVTRLFNASLDDIFAELIQNARRAGATTVTIDHVDHETLGPAIRFHDNGPGLKDPQSLFTLGQSAWSGATIVAEDAAGMGFFSLAGRTIQLIAQKAGTHQSWRLDVEPAAFRGEKPILCANGPDGHTGTTIYIETKLNENLVAAANHAALFCPIEVVIEGVVAERKDFLQNADHIDNWNGIRIGLYENSPTAFRNKGNVNFYGVTLQAQLPSLTQNYHRAYYARLDVTDCVQLKLVLQARKEIVADAFFTKLQTHIQKLMFRHIACNGRHSLSFSSWSKAEELGVGLPPAAMLLRPFSPAQADRDQNDYLSPVDVTRDALLLDSDDNPIEDQNLAWALSGEDGAPTLYEPNGAFIGYDWYDQLSYLAITGYRLTHAHGEERLLPGHNALTHERPDVLHVEGQIGTTTDLIPWQLETDRLILGPEDSYFDDADLCVTSASNPDHNDLVDLLQRALFNPSDDADAGSYDDQLQSFTDNAEDLVIKLLQTNQEANINAIQRIIARELYWICKPAFDVTIRIAEGHITVDGLEPSVH
jgi:hypothetical protein